MSVDLLTNAWATNALLPYHIRQRLSSHSTWQVTCKKMLSVHILQQLEICCVLTKRYHPILWSSTTKRFWKLLGRWLGPCAYIAWGFKTCVMHCKFVYSCVNAANTTIDVGCSCGAAGCDWNLYECKPTERTGGQSLQQTYAVPRLMIVVILPIAWQKWSAHLVPAVLTMACSDHPGQSWNFPCPNMPCCSRITALRKADGADKSGV